MSLLFKCLKHPILSNTQSASVAYTEVLISPYPDQEGN